MLVSVSSAPAWVRLCARAGACVPACRAARGTRAHALMILCVGGRAMRARVCGRVSRAWCRRVVRVPRACHAECHARVPRRGGAGSELEPSACGTPKPPRGCHGRHTWGALIRQRMIAMRKRMGPGFPWAALVAIFAGGNAAMGTLANYAEGALHPFFVVLMGLLGGLLAYVMLPLGEAASKKISRNPLCGRGALTRTCQRAHSSSSVSVSVSVLSLVKSAPHTPQVMGPVA